MRASTICASCFIASTAAFSLSASSGEVQLRTTSRTQLVHCSVSDDALFSRRAVLAGVAGAVIGVHGAPAFAGYVTSLGLETTKPSDAEKDDEILATKEVQQAIKSLKAYKESANTLKVQFDSDNNLNLIPAIRKEFDFSKVRDDLNVATTVFDEQTQQTLDRLQRAVLYDLTELENASRFKKGEDSRTPKKTANVQKWFEKLDLDFGSYLAYF